MISSSGGASDSRIQKSPSVRDVDRPLAERLPRVGLWSSWSASHTSRRGGTRRRERDHCLIEIRPDRPLLFSV